MDGFIVLPLYVGAHDGSGVVKIDRITFTVPVCPSLFGAPIAIWVPFDDIATYLPAASPDRSPAILSPR